MINSRIDCSLTNNLCIYTCKYSITDINIFCDIWNQFMEAYYLLLVFSNIQISTTFKC